MTRMILVILLAGLACSPAPGQSINIDFGDGSGAPTADYAAAGLSGVWNVLTAGPGAPEPLVGLNGEVVAATLTLDFGSPTMVDDPATSNNDERLLDDGLGDLGDVMLTVSFEGLTVGTYAVTTYCWTPTAPGDSTWVIINNDLNNGQIGGGPWPGGLEEGVTHVVHEVEVTDGNMTIGAAGGILGASGFLNGIQLRRITVGDFDGDGLVGITDLLILLSNWGPCPPKVPCPADLDANGTVGIIDLLILLANWG